MNIHKPISNESEDKPNKKDYCATCAFQCHCYLFLLLSSFESSFHICTIHKSSSMMVIMNQRLSCCCSPYTIDSLTYGTERMGLKTKILRKTKKKKKSNDYVEIVDFQTFKFVFASIGVCSVSLTSVKFKIIKISRY